MALSFIQNDTETYFMHALSNLFSCLRVSDKASEPILQPINHGQQMLAKLCYDSVTKKTTSEAVVRLLELKEALASGQSSKEVPRRVIQIEKLSLFNSRAIYVSNWLAWVVNVEADFCDKSPFVDGAVRFLLENAQFKEGWLGQLFPKDQLPHVTKRIVEAIQQDVLGEKIVGLYKRLENFNGFALTKPQLVSLAVFAAVGLEEGRCAFIKYFKKERFGLPRSLQWDGQKKVFYVLSKSDVSLRGVSSTYKRVTHAVRVPLSHRQPIIHAGHAVNALAEDADSILDEVQFQQRLYKVQSTGVWPIWHSCQYKKEQAYKERRSIITKTSFLSPLADGTLREFFRFADLSKRVEAIIQLCSCLYCLHRSNLLHGDIKDKNVLHKQYTESLVVGFIDFGFLSGADEPQKNLPGMFNKGFYGSVVPTAPEFLLEYAFTGDMAKVEMWAFGHMLRHAISNTSLPWDADVQKLSNGEIDATKKPAILACMKDTIENERALLLEGRTKEDLDPYFRLRLFICDLMRYDPALRFNSHQALIEIKQIQALVTRALPK